MGNKIGHISARNTTEDLALDAADYGPVGFVGSAFDSTPGQNAIYALWTPYTAFTAAVPVPPTT